MTRRANRAARTLVLLPALLTTTLALAAGLFAPATADTAVVPDGTGDVWWYGEGPQGPQWVQVEDREQEDVTAVRVDHRDRRLVITTEVVDLPAADESPGAGPEHVVDRARGRDLYVDVDITGNQSSVAVGAVEGRYRCGDDDVRLGVDRETDVVTVTLGRACLKAQRWVRVTSTMSSITGRHPYVDAVGNDGHDDGETTRRLRAG